MKPKTSMNTPTTSKAQEWWHPFIARIQQATIESKQDRVDELALSIIRESQRLQMEEVKRKIKELRWYKSDIPHSPKAAYHEAFKDILKHLASLTNGDVEKQEV